MQIFLRLFYVSIMILISGCQPSFMVEESLKFSKQIGIVDDFDISRWHSRVFPRDSRFVFFTDSAPEDVRRAINSAGETAFQRFFTKVESNNGESRYKALNNARMSGAHFLVVCEILSSEVDHTGNIVKGRQHKAVHLPDKVIATDGEPYKNIQLLMTVVSLNAEVVVDKISVSSSQILKPYSGLNTLLHEPMLAVAKELSGG